MNKNPCIGLQGCILLNSVYLVGFALIISELLKDTSSSKFQPLLSEIVLWGIITSIGLYCGQIITSIGLQCGQIITSIGL